MAMLDPVYLERINTEMAPPAETVESPESTNTSISSSSGSSITSAV
jgi:hypothetical protein